MTNLVLQTPEGVTVRREIAGAGSRLAAGLIDLGLLVLGYLAALVVVSLGTGVDPSGVSGFLFGLLAGGGLLLIVGYFTVFPVLWQGETPGKRLLGVRVTAADGYLATPLQHVLRSLLLPVDIFVTVPVPLGLVLIAVSRRRARLGDLVAGTTVLRDEGRAQAPEPWPDQRWEAMENRTLALDAGMAARLDQEDVDFLRDLVSRRGLETEERRKLFVKAARHYARKLDLGPFEDARVVLRELYLFARDARRASG